MSLHDDPLLSEFTEMITELVTDFVPHQEFPRFRVPLHTTPLDPICDHVGLDPANDPQAISRNLFLLEWDSLCGYSSFWHLHALRLESGERVYWVDDANGRRIIAIGPGGVGADLRFARAFFRSNGEAFGTAVLDSAPSRISTTLRGEKLIDLFLDAFHCSPNAWGVIDVLTRSAIRDWLKATLANEGKELRGPRLTDTEAHREFLALVEGLVSEFTPHPEEPRVGVPRRFTPLRALAKLLRRKVDSLLQSVSYQVFQFAWSFAPGVTFLQRICAIRLADGSRVFWFYMEADDDEESQYFIAGTVAAEITDLRFLQLLFDGNGAAFNAEVCGCAPTEIITPLEHTPEVVDLFVSAYTGFPQAWDSLRDHQPKDRLLDPQNPEQARELVERHLRAVMI